MLNNGNIKRNWKDLVFKHFKVMGEGVKRGKPQPRHQQNHKNEQRVLRRIKKRP